MLSEIQGKTQDVTVYEDNQSTIHLIKNPTFHERTKHMEIIKMLFFIRDVVAKVLPSPKFKYCMELVQVIDPGGQSGDIL